MAKTPSKFRLSANTTASLMEVTRAYEGKIVGRISKTSQYGYIRRIVLKKEVRQVTWTYEYWAAEVCWVEPKSSTETVALGALYDLKEYEYSLASDLIYLERVRNEGRLKIARVEGVRPR